MSNTKDIIYYLQRIFSYIIYIDKARNCDETTLQNFYGSYSQCPNKRVARIKGLLGKSQVYRYEFEIQVI